MLEVCIKHDIDIILPWFCTSKLLNYAFHVQTLDMLTQFIQLLLVFQSLHIWIDFFHVPSQINKFHIYFPHCVHLSFEFVPYLCTVPSRCVLTNNSISFIPPTVSTFDSFFCMVLLASLLSGFQLLKLASAELTSACYCLDHVFTADLLSLSQQPAS